MILTIDIGNSNINFGIFDQINGNLLNYANIKTDKNTTTDELAIKYLGVLNLWGISNKKEIKNVIISSVVPQLDYNFQHLFEKYFNIKPFFVLPKFVPIRINYENPSEIGADRIVNAYAGVVLYPGNNLIIIDFGTATTVDIINNKNEYLGGLIITGILTSLEALTTKASKLPHIKLDIPKSLIGKNTIESIRSGIINGYGAMIDELIRRIKTELNWNDCLAIGTGGLSQLIKNSAYFLEILEPHLIHKGLYYIWKYNNENNNM